jgi:hypothetical protein
VRKIDRLQSDVEDLRADYTTLKADIMYASKQSEVARRVKELGLKESLNPPFKVVVEKVNIKKSILVRVRVAFLGMMIFAICVAAKIRPHIQVVDGSKWEKLSEEINFDYKKVKATRGNIYSDNGSLLGNKPAIL